MLCEGQSHSSGSLALRPPRITHIGYLPYTSYGTLSVHLQTQAALSKPLGHQGSERTAGVVNVSTVFAVAVIKTKDSEKWSAPKQLRVFWTLSDAHMIAWTSCVVVWLDSDDLHEHSLRLHSRWPHLRPTQEQWLYKTGAHPTFAR